MTIYNDVFGGANVYPSDISYRAVALSANVTLNWPDETSAATDYAARIMDVTASAASLVITLPDARGASPGETILFNNLGAETFIVKDAAGVQVVSIASGEAWQIYLDTNTTAAGSWRAFQYGAGVSSADASSLAGTGLIAIGSLLSQSVPVTSIGASYIALDSDRARMYVWTGGGGNLTLPNPNTVGNNWFMLVRNGGTGVLTLDTDGISTIDGSATKDYNPAESSIVATDGTNYFTLGFGQAVEFAFDYTSINIAGSGTYTLAGGELNRVAYKLTGILTGNRTVVVPATVQQYWFNNETSGGYTVRIETTSGGGLFLDANRTTIVYSDGTSVIPANNASSTLSTVSGGTF